MNQIWLGKNTTPDNLDGHLQGPMMDGFLSVLHHIWIDKRQLLYFLKWIVDPSMEIQKWTHRAQRVRCGWETLCSSERLLLSLGTWWIPIAPNSKIFTTGEWFFTWFFSGKSTSSGATSILNNRRQVPLWLFWRSLMLWSNHRNRVSPEPENSTAFAYKKYNK